MRRLLALALLVVAACGGSDSKNNDNNGDSDNTSKATFPSVATCTPSGTIAVGTGQAPQVITKLAISSATDAIDLDDDGTPDNAMAVLPSLTPSDPIAPTLTNNQLVLPMEFFGASGAAATSCVNLAMYDSTYAVDFDGDGFFTARAGGDCNDHDDSIHPGADEVASNGLDDDCDGLADEGASNTPSSDISDADSDGHSIATGDCDDHDSSVFAGHPEICDDGLDNDCDGAADHGLDASGIACSPFVPSASLVASAGSLLANKPLYLFGAGEIVATDDVLLVYAKADKAFVSLPVPSVAFFPLPLTGARLQGTVVADGASFHIENGRVGGAVSVPDLAALDTYQVLEYHLFAGQSFLDAIFVGGLGATMDLPAAAAAVNAKYQGCLSADVDIDGDGLEAFCDSQTGQSEGAQHVDVCVDGDGTEVC